jgi:hypothetical protein
MDNGSSSGFRRIPTLVTLAYQLQEVHYELDVSHATSNEAGCGATL